MPYQSHPRYSRAFTLIEIMIVVIILGILAAVTIPELTSATTETRANTLHEEVRFMREQIEAFKYEHTDISPGYPSGATTSTPDQADFINQMIGATNVTCVTVSNGSPGSFGPYISTFPVNPVNGLATVLVVANGTTFPTSADGAYGWVYQPSTMTFKSDATGSDQSGADYFSY
ncbi:MAG TPA: type II secretion system protein [Tepidisphaeraceae bacterium]|jgi:prepilin-type N-terminal cleavage/methylation domain-containing protein